MDAERRKINGNNNNNDNYCEVSITIPEVKLQPAKHETGLSKSVSSIETIEIEPQVEKIDVTEYNAPHSRRKREENSSDTEEDTIIQDKDKHEELDETDSPGKNKSHFIEMEEEDSNMEEAEMEEQEPKKQFNSYAAKKTVAQGMMDIALITANANQLRYLIEFNRHSPTFIFIVMMIVISLFIQVAVGVALIFKGRLDIKGKSKDPGAKKINNYVVVGIFLVTIINVFIASFTITGGSTGVNI